MSAPQVPSTQELTDNIVSQVGSALSASIPLLPKAFTRVFAKATAGVVTIGYKYSAWSWLQMYARFASARETVVAGKTIIPLVELGRQLGVGDPKEAEQSELNVEVTVLDQTGSLPGGTQLVRTETEVIYITVAAVALDAATKTLKIRASSDQQGGDGAGVIGNLEPGDIVQFVNPGKVARNAVVVSTAVQGADAEDIGTSYRQRVIDRRQKPPKGGAYADYEAWAEEVAGIVAAYPYPGDPGEIEVYCEATEASSGSADGIPTAAQLTAVYDNIQLLDGLATRRPINDAVSARAISRESFDITVPSLVVPNPSDVKASISTGVDEFLRTREPFIVGLSALPRRDRVTKADVAGIVNAIVAAAGGTVGELVISQGGSPFVTYSLGKGETAKLGTVTYT